MSEVIVAKFGGTSVATEHTIIQCAELVKANSRINLVVVSAQSGITNLLIDLINQNINHIPVEQTISTIREIIFSIVNHINDEQVFNQIDEIFAELRVFVNMASYFNNKQISDAILSFGERVSAVLVSNIFAQQGIQTCYLDSREILRTNSNFGCAEPNISQIGINAQKFILPQIEQGKVCVISGFIGSDNYGNTTTLGRGCGDYSAALYAQAVKANCLKIYTDVVGIYQADPRVIPTAQAIEKLSFSEAAELATFGAKVVHPKTFAPAISAGFDIHINSTFAPSESGTIISQAESHYREIVGVAERKEQTLLTIKSFNMFGSRGFLASVFNILAQHNIAVDLVTTSEVSIAITLDKLGSHSTGENLVTTELLDDLENIGNVEITVEDKMSLVSIVGNNLHQTAGISGKLFSSLHDVNIRLLSHGASENSISILVSSENATEVVQRIYNTFFTEEQDYANSCNW